MKLGSRTLSLLTLAGLILLVPGGVSAQGGASAQSGSASAQASGTKPASDIGIVIKKNAITSVASFIPYKVQGRDMEIIAVRASDGTIRTALNTCQVCYQSGRGYYKQVGDVFVCQNCGNRFRIDQVEKIKGGCNPVPVLEGDKTDLGETIGISKAYLEGVAPYFAYWKKRG